MPARLVMDPQTAGWIGGVAGGVLGLGGAAVGIYASLRGAKTPAERAVIWIGSALLFLLIGAHLAALFLIPPPWNQASWLLYVFALMGTIGWINRRQAKVGATGQDPGAG